MNQEQFDSLIELLEGIGLEPYSYSGRGMYGKRCLAVDTDSPLETMAIIALEAVDVATELEDARDTIEALQYPSSDSMGRSSVLYWSRIEWLGHSEDSDD